MRVLFICGYYSDLAHRRVPRTEIYWDAYFYVWAVKTGQFKRSFKIHNGSSIESITANNSARSRQLFGSWLNNQLPKLQAEDALLVPVPSKDALVGATTSRSLGMLQEAVTGTAASGRVLDALKWTERLAKAHEGGPRGREALLPFLQSSGVSGKKIVLVDDLFSKGGSLLACQDKLKAEGATVLGALTCGRTIYDFNTKAFCTQEIDLTHELNDWTG